MKKEYVVPIEIQSELVTRADICSAKYLIKGYRFIPDARGRFIYLRLLRPDGILENLGRFTYTGDKEKMDFALFLHDSEKYSFDCFLGDKYLDGTLEGALKALAVVYNLQSTNSN